MQTMNGVYTSAIIFNGKTTEYSVEDYALAQIKALCDHPAFEGCKIRIMPDVHPGKVGTIGFTSTLGQSILPNVIGIDIGCGITVARIKGRVKEFQKVDRVIRENVPSGFHIRSKAHHLAMDFDFSELHCARHIDQARATVSLGTLGGGNHFIEMDENDDKETFLVIHSGSRHLGKEVTEHYLREGQKVLRSRSLDVPYELTWLDGTLMEDYLHDLEVVQRFARLNREIILDELAKGMKWKITDQFDCIHNYVDFDASVPIIRKGAISAKAAEPVAIPINMRDGVILGTGLGNEEWNNSAPHGAGRLMKREEIKNHYTVSNFKTAMKGIYSSCIGSDTLDEAPFAYRGLADIADAVQDTVSISQIIHPIYNFKAGGD